MNCKTISAITVVIAFLLTSTIAPIEWTQEPVFAKELELESSGGIIINNSITWSNQYGSLTVTPHTSTGIIQQTQYAELVSNITAEIDVAFRFNDSLGNKNIWIWKNISHDVKVPDYGYIPDDYTLYNISDIEVINESVANESGIDFGDIPSNYYRRGNASYWDDEFNEWWNNTFCIGFDSFNWLNPEHTNATFYYEYWGITGHHIEQQFWFDWKSIKHKFNHREHNNKHYYYVTEWMVKKQTYNFKWQYDTPLNTEGKWDLLAKLHSDPIGTWRIELDPWWSSNWEYMKVCNIVNPNNSYQMEINVSYDDTLDGGENITCDSHCNANFSDIRFVDIDNTTELDYWMEEKVDSDYAVFWIETPADVETDNRLLMYYGNAGASTTSNGTNTFLFFEDGSTAGSWTLSGGASTLTQETLFGESWLKHDSDHTNACQADLDIYNLTSDFCVEYKFRKDDYDGNADMILCINPTDWGDLYQYYQRDAPDNDHGTYTTGAAWCDFGGYSLNTNYSYKTINLFSTDTSQYFINGASQGWYAWREVTNEVNWINHIHLHADDNDIVRYRTLRIRPYSATEPTWSGFSSEKLEPAIPVNGNFTYTTSGCIVTATPTLSSSVDYYKWTTENNINSETEWISSDDTIDHMFVLNYGTSYIITLYYKNETEDGSYSAHVEIGTQHATVDLEEEEVVEEPLEVSKFKNMFDDFPQGVKDWFADRNATETTIMSLAVISLALFLVLASKKKNYRYYILTKRKKK